MEKEIGDFLKKYEIPFESYAVEEGELTFSFSMKNKLGLCPVYVILGENDEPIQIALASPVLVLSEDRFKTASYLNELNNGPDTPGEFSIDMERGKVLYHRFFLVTDKEGVEQSLIAIMKDTEQLLPGILGVAFGDNDGELPFAQTYEPDTWVKFNTDLFIEPGHIIIEGMLGQVIYHPYAHYICTPGISTMIRPLGLDVEYGYFNLTFDALDAEPTDEEREKSEALREAAFSIYEEKHGYSGFALLGTKLFRQEKLAKEMAHSTERVVEWFEESGQEKHIKGTMKRIRKVLEALEKHPNGEAALELAARVEDANVNSEDVPELMEKVAEWFEKAMEQERIKSQKERIDTTKSRLP